MIYYWHIGRNMRAANAAKVGEESSMSDPRARRHDDPAAFPLPVSGLFADLEMGIGCVRLSDDFFAASNAIQIEVLCDWRRAIDELRLRALVGLYRDIAGALPDLSDEEKLLRFRVTCQSLDIEYPDDMTTLLQRF